MPNTLPGFERLQLPSSFLTQGMEGRCFRRNKLRILLSVDDFEHFQPGAGVWAHASLSRPDRDPSWAEIKEVRDIVFGRDRCVIQVLAPAQYWLNFHEHCFHLLMRLDAETVPRLLYDQEGCDGKAYGERAPFPIRESAP
jgi:hypothetical protein